MNITPNMEKRLNILMIDGESNLTIPLRTETAEIFGEYLVKYGHKITVILLSSKVKNLRTFKWKNINFYELPVYARFKRLFFLYKLIKRSNFDILQIRECPLEGILAFLIRKNKKLPLVYQYINPGTDEKMNADGVKYYYLKPIERLINNFLELRVMKKAELVLPTSCAMGKHLIKQGIQEQKILPLPNGANIDLFNPSVSGEEIRSRLVLGSTPILVYVGVIAKVRQLDILIHVMALILKYRSEVKLLMVGDGDDKDNLKKLSRMIGIDKNIIFTGRIAYEDIPKYVAASDICISPIPPLDFYKVSSPLKLFEYMSMGKPVVANLEIPEQKEVLDQSGGGILVSFTVDAFARAISELLEHPKEAQEMGKKGRKWIENHRTYEALALQLEERYYQLLREC